MGTNGVHVLAGPDDPRLYEVDDEFRELLIELSSLMAASKARQRRVFHSGATTAGGVLQVVDDREGPAHDFFRSGRRFRVVARYSNALASDDIAPSVRGLTLRLLEPEATDLTQGLLDLPLNTGSCFYAPTADAFQRSQARGPSRDEVLRQRPHMRSTLWASYRNAVSYADYDYYSQVPRCFLDVDGRGWFVRYRLVPRGGARDAGVFDPGDLWLPPDPPQELTRPGSDARPPTFLHDELRARLGSGEVAGLLQIQLHPVTSVPGLDEGALNGSLPWSPEVLPWHDLATLRLSTLMDDEDTERLAFSPGLAPASLGIALGPSPRQNASINHLRVLLYQMTSAARRGQRPPAALEELLRPRPGRPHPPDARPLRPPRTVCVLGGGPSGLAAAREIERAGHRVIVLESGATVGGRCESLEIDGRSYDLGGHLCTTAYPRVARLIRELDIHTEDTTPHHVYDVESRRSAPQSAAFFRREVFGRYAALRARQFPRIGEPGLAHSARALAMPIRQWLIDNDLGPLAESLGTGYTAAGYGSLDGDLPALYFVKYAEMTGLLSNTPELLGHAGSFTVTGGFARLWKNVAAGLKDVRCGARIHDIERRADGVRVQTSAGLVEADDLVVTVPLDQVVHLMDATDVERALASEIRYIDYYTTLCTATGLPRAGFYLTPQAARPGECVAFHHRYPDSDVYACYSYGAPGVDRSEIAATLEQHVEKMGGRLHAVHIQRRWRHMPHFEGTDVRSGAYDRIDDLQGQRHTYHAGSLPSFDLVECAVAQAQDLAHRWFSAGPIATERASAAPRRSGELARPVTVDSVRAWLVARMAAELEVAETEIDPGAPLESYALESVSNATLQAELSEWMGFRIPHTVFFELPTIEAVARYLAERSDDTAAPPTGAGERPAAEPVRAPLLLNLTPARPFFCAGGIVGATYYLRPLALAVGHAQPFVGLQPPGLDGDEEPLDRIEDLAARYVEELRRMQRHGPYWLGGHSFGGLVAYEIGRQLDETGEDVAHVVLLDTYLTVPGQPPLVPDEIAAIEELQRMNRLIGSDAACECAIDRTLSLPEQRERLARALGATGALPADEYIVNMLEVYQANLDALVTYQPQPSRLPVTLIRASGGFPPVMGPGRSIQCRATERNGWDELGLPELRVVEVPGDHFSMLAEPHREAVAAAIRRCLDGRTS
jgi:thioesterase domain-containing protein/acyl carrier protein